MTLRVVSCPADHGRGRSHWSRTKTTNWSLRKLDGGIEAVLENLRFEDQSEPFPYSFRELHFGKLVSVLKT
jgi:hypothetical protein